MGLLSFELPDRLDAPLEDVGNKLAVRKDAYVAAVPVLCLNGALLPTALRAGPIALGATALHFKKRPGIRVRVVSENGYRSSATRTEWQRPGASSEVGGLLSQSGHMCAPTSDMAFQA